MPTLRSLPALGFPVAALTIAVLSASACSSSGGGPAARTGSGGSAATGGASAAGGSANGGHAGAGAAGNAGTASGGAVGMAGSAGTGGGSAMGGGSATGGGSGNCIVCDDFESSSTAPDPAKWTIDSSRVVGTATIDTTTGAHGSAKSLKVSGGFLKIDTKAGLFTGVAPTFWVRVNMRFSVAQPMDHVTYLMFTDKGMLGGMPVTGQLRVGAQHGGMIWNYDTNDTILPDYNEAANSLSPPANEWHCFEFEIDSPTPGLHVFMDSVETPKMLLDTTVTDGIDSRWLGAMTGWKPSITNFSFGSGDPSSSGTTWYDDIAISNSRPGCTF